MKMQNFFRSAYSAIAAPTAKNVSVLPLRLFSRVLRAISRSACVPLRRRLPAIVRRGETTAGAFVPSSNSGIALIMVLGLLTVMVILAVTFAVSMRTERLAAGNSADNVRARELVQVGLSRAMNQLAAELGTNGLSSTGTKKAYPNWNVTNSYTNINPAGDARWNYTNALIQKSATNYVPRALWTEATNVDRSILFPLSSPNHWLPVESVAPPAPGLPNETNLMGRVAYLILNCSGLLDANYAGSMVTRGPGTNPSEIAIANLAEIGANLNDFLTARGNDVRYETLAQLNSSMTNYYKQATNLFVYSRSLPGYWSTNWNCVATQVNLSGTAAELGNTVRRNAIITNGFMQAGFSDSAAWVLHRNLIDYIDDDNCPTLFTTCVEAVPMINEIIFQCEPAEPPLNNKKLSITYELWFPFVAGGGTFKFNGQVKFSPTLPCNTVSNNFIISSPGFKLIGPFTTTTIDPDPFVPTIVNAEVTDSSGQIIDELTPNSILPISITNDSSINSMECLDPRLNKDPTDPLYWRLDTTPTPDTTNSWVTDWWQTNQNGDVYSEMYVADRPLKSVAELGYLVYTNAPWRTVKLFGPALHRVLDVFGLSTNVDDVFMTNAIVSRGLVNCNPNVAMDATAVVFAGMPVDQYPGEVSTLTPPTMDQARLVAVSIFNGGYYTNLSDVGRSLNPPPGATELEKESYFRNAFSLLNLRQNMFTIIIEAQAASGGNIPRNPAKQRAVAIVWRDPYTGEMLVRHIKWLGD